MTKALETLDKLELMSESAEAIIAVRDEVRPKLARTFTRAEACEYLKCDYRTVMRYVDELDIDPTAFKEYGLEWVLDLTQVYLIRDALPDTTILKKQFKPFQRSNGQTTQVIAAKNQKGGAGKTSAVVMLGAGIATEYHEQYRVCIIDLDGQSTASSYHPPIDGVNTETIGSLLVLDPTSSDYQHRVKSAVADTLIPNMKIIRASQSDRDVEAKFHVGILDGSITEPYTRLSQIIDVIKGDFDIIIIDTSPSLGYSSINAYFAATSVIIPVAATQNDTDATCQYISYLPKLYKRLMKDGHGGYDFIKILSTNYEDSSSCQEVQKELSTYFGSTVMGVPFKKSEAVRLCALNKNSVFDLSTSSYPSKTKATFKAARLNAVGVLHEVMKEINITWNKQRLNR